MSRWRVSDKEFLRVASMGDIDIDIMRGLSRSQKRDATSRLGQKCLHAIFFQYRYTRVDEEPSNCDGIVLYQHQKLPQI